MLVQTQVHYDVVFFFFFLSPSSGCACHLGFLQALMCLPEGRKYHATVLKCVASLRKKLNFASFRYGPPTPHQPHMFGLPMFRNNLKSYRISDTTMGAGSSSFCCGFVVSVIKFETKQLEKRSRNLMDCKQFLCAKAAGSHKPNEKLPKRKSNTPQTHPLARLSQTHNAMGHTWTPCEITAWSF